MNEKTKKFLILFHEPGGIMKTIINVIIVLGVVFLPTNVPGLILGLLLTLMGLVIRLYRISIDINFTSTVMIVSGLIITIQMFMNMRKESR